MAFCLASEKPILERRLTPDGEDNPNHRALPTFFSGDEESFWGDVYGETKQAWKRLLEADSLRQRDRYAVRESYQRRRSRREPYRNGYYERRAEDVAMLIREAFLRGISTR